jgi:hypothetical protein
MVAMLPKKLSELLRMALDDLYKAERDPRFFVDMGAWYCVDEDNPDRCLCCLAGAVIANRMNVNPASERYDMPEGVDPDDACVLQALDHLRSGNIQAAEFAMGNFNSEVENFTIEPYWQDPDQWREDMEAMLVKMKELGL